MAKKTLPAAASAVVIGGGIVGLSVLYHLTRMGWRDVVLLERNTLSSGTTWHSAALLSQLRGTHAQTRMAKYSAQLYRRLQEETGIDTGLRQNGHFNIACNADRLNELRYTISLARAFDVEVDWAEPGDLERRWPEMKTDDVIAALWTPSVGRADPTNICHAFAKAARAGGAEVFEHTSVVGMTQKNGQIAAVDTSAGRIETSVVVNCAGLWGREIAALVGERAPLYACEHFYLLTEPMGWVTPDLPLFRDGDAHLYVREEVGGLLIGCFEPNPKPLPVEKLPEGASYILLNEDWDHFGPMLEGAIERIPALETAGVKLLLNGPESFTHDNAPLMGEAPDLRGFWSCCGMNSSGIALGGGAGWVTAEWIASGEPPLDASSLDIKRFPAALDTVRGLQERIPEVLSHHFSVRYPSREMQSARGVRRSAVHDRMAERGAYFGARSGWEKPQWFDAPLVAGGVALKFGRPVWQDAVDRECAAVRGGVAVFEQSSFGKIRIEGADAEAMLQYLCAADISREGRANYTPVLNEAGGFVSDLTVIREGADAFVAITGTAQTERDLAYFKSHARDRNVAVTDVTSGLGTLLVTGPDARAALARLTPSDLSTDMFPFAAAREIEVGLARALAVRMSFAGEIGWELHLPTEVVASVWEALFEVWPDLVPAGSLALNTCRLEKGFRSWGHDIGPTDDAVSAGMGFNIDWTKGFVGRAALEAIRSRGPTRRLVVLGFDGSSWPSGHHPVYRNGALAGEVTSAAHSAFLGSSVALAWIEKGGMARDALETDSFEVEVQDRRYPADLHLRPLYDRKGERLRA
jgi:heterotetrameric sarcosine oxidase gamma subunit